MRVRAQTRRSASNGWHNMGEQEAPEHVRELLEDHGTVGVIIELEDKSQLRYRSIVDVHAAVQR